MSAGFGSGQVCRQQKSKRGRGIKRYYSSEDVVEIHKLIQKGILPTEVIQCRLNVDVFAVVIIFIPLTLESRYCNCCCWIFFSHVVLILLHHLDDKCRWSGNETGLAGHSRKGLLQQQKCGGGGERHQLQSLYQKSFQHLLSQQRQQKNLFPELQFITNEMITWFHVFFRVLLWHHTMFVLLKKMYFVMESYCTDSRKAVSLSNIATDDEFCNCDSKYLAKKLLFCFNNCKTP